MLTTNLRGFFFFFPFSSFSSFQGMPGENEKQRDRLLSKYHGLGQYVRERSEHPSSAGGDGRRVECFAVGGELPTGLGSGQAGYVPLAP